MAWLCFSQAVKQLASHGLVAISICRGRAADIDGHAVLPFLSSGGRMIQEGMVVDWSGTLVCSNNVA